MRVACHQNKRLCLSSRNAKQVERVSVSNGLLDPEPLPTDD